MIQWSDLNQNQIQRLEINHKCFLTIQRLFLTPKDSINTPKIIQFHYKLIHPHITSISLSNNFFFVLYPNFLEYLCELRYVSLFINFVFMHILFSFILVLK